MRNERNWFGVTGVVCTLILIVVSVFVPWWRLTVGSEFVQANWSPLNTNFDLGSKNFTVPLLMALNISSTLLLVTGSIAMLIYSLYPRKPYAKTLLEFAYRKPLYALVLFVIGLVAVVLLPKLLADVDIPLFGSVNMILPLSLTQGVLTSIPVSAYFQWPFALAIVSVVLCIAARVYHKRILSSTPANTPAPANPSTSTTTAGSTIATSPAPQE